MGRIGQIQSPASDPFQLAPEDRVLYGQYGLGGGEAKLFLVIYKEPGKAERVTPALQKLFSPEKGFRPAGQPAGASAWVKEGRFHLLRKGAGHLMLVTGASSLEEAAEIARE